MLWAHDDVLAGRVDLAGLHSAFAPVLANDFPLDNYKRLGFFTHTNWYPNARGKNAVPQSRQTLDLFFTPRGN